MKRILKNTLIFLISAIIFCGILLLSQPKTYAEAATEDKNTVILGGMPIGLQAQSHFFTVTDFINVITSEGSYSPAQKGGMEKGDIILAINGIRPDSISQLSQLIEDNEKTEFTIKRRNEIIKIGIKCKEDMRKKAKKAGMMVKNDLSGIGTVTYIQQNGNFGALGHPISDAYGISDIYQTGTVYDCTVYGYKRAEKEKPGELIGQIDIQKPIGSFYSNTLSGILGKLNELPKNGKQIKVAGKEQVVPGKAYICTTIDGNTPSTYEIEIIKATKQDIEKEKSMVIRVTDPTLLKTTGGILQGMSGSPIIQNGKLIGAVTHVLTSDSTMGYGIYIEWMMN